MVSIIPILNYLILNIILVLHPIRGENRYFFRVGSDLLLPCAPPDTEDIVNFFTWKKDGFLLPDKSIIGSSRFEILGNFSLKIGNVTEDDHGMYTCYIETNPPLITDYIVEIEAPPSIRKYPANEALVLKEGDDGDLICLAKGRPPPKMIWKFQGMIIYMEKHQDILFPNKTISSIYRIANSQRQDAGVYSCTADNGVDDPVTVDFYVEILYAPKINVDHSWVHAGLGSQAELKCDVYAHPTAKVEWFRNGTEQVFGSNRIGTVANGTKYCLKFKTVKDADLGLYFCRAENEFGQAEAALELSGLAGKAALRVAAPRDGHKLEQEGKVHHLIWNVISHSLLYEYRLWLRPRGQGQEYWKNIIIPVQATKSTSFLHSHSYTLENLGTGTVYEITVQSRNRFGWSEESERVFVSEDPDIYDDQNELLLSHTSESINTLASTMSSTATEFITSETNTQTTTPLTTTTMTTTSPTTTSTTISSVATIPLSTTTTLTTATSVATEDTATTTPRQLFELEQELQEIPTSQTTILVDGSGNVLEDDDNIFATPIITEMPTSLTTNDVFVSSTTQQLSLKEDKSAGKEHVSAVLHTNTGIRSSWSCVFVATITFLNCMK